MPVTDSESAREWPARVILLRKANLIFKKCFGFAAQEKNTGNEILTLRGTSMVKRNIISGQELNLVLFLLNDDFNVLQGGMRS